MSLNTKRKEKIIVFDNNQRTVLSRLQPHQSLCKEGQGNPREALDPKEMELAEVKLGLRREEKGLRILTSQSILMS